MMQSLKTFLTVLLLVSILPLCNLAAASASAATGGGDGRAYVLDDAALALATGINETQFAAPLKSKRVAVLQQGSCGAQALCPSGADALVLPSGAEPWAAEHLDVTMRDGPAPPTSPPRSD